MKRTGWWVFGVGLVIAIVGISGSTSISESVSISESINLGNAAVWNPNVPDPGVFDPSSQYAAISIFNGVAIAGILSVIAGLALVGRASSLTTVTRDGAIPVQVDVRLKATSPDGGQYCVECGTLRGGNFCTSCGAKFA